MNKKAALLRRAPSVVGVVYVGAVETTASEHKTAEYVRIICGLANTYLCHSMRLSYWITHRKGVTKISSFNSSFILDIGVWYMGSGEWAAGGRVGRQAGGGRTGGRADSACVHASLYASV